MVDTEATPSDGPVASPPRRRPTRGGHALVTLSFMVRAKQLSEIDRIAKRRYLSRSVVLREALDGYLTTRFKGGSDNQQQ